MSQGLHIFLLYDIDKDNEIDSCSIFLIFFFFIFFSSSIFSFLALDFV